MKDIKASRRGFLKFGAGAAVAGPSAAKSVLEQPLVAAGMKGISSSAAVADIGLAMSGEDYDANGGYTLSGAQRRIKHLLGKASQKHQVARARREAIGSNAQLRIEELRIDGMRSVSPSYKARMILESYIDVRARREQHWMTEEMDQLIEKYPALSIMVGSRGDDA